MRDSYPGKYVRDPGISRFHYLPLQNEGSPYYRIHNQVGIIKKSPARKQNSAPPFLAHPTIGPVKDISNRLSQDFAILATHFTKFLPKLVSSVNRSQNICLRVRKFDYRRGFRDIVSLSDPSILLKTGAFL